MEIGFLTHLVILLFAVLVVIGAFAFLVIDMFSRVDYLKEKAPWLQRVTERRSAIGVLFLVAVFLLIGDGYELVIREVPESKGLQITFPAPSAPSVSIQKRIIKTTGSGRLDRDLNEQQSNHLYSQLRQIADTPSAFGLANVTLVDAYPQDRESLHLFGRLAKVFGDAHWKVTPHHGWPIPGLEGRAKNELPIGIWIMTDNAFLRISMWNDFQEAGLDSQDRSPTDLPADYKGLTIVIGYKDVPF